MSCHVISYIYIISYQNMHCIDAYVFLTLYIIIVLYMYDYVCICRLYSVVLLYAETVSSRTTKTV